MEKIRQSLLLAVMLSSHDSPDSGVVCLHLGRCAMRGREWGSFIWGEVEERSILLLRVSENRLIFFTLVLSAADFQPAEKESNGVFCCHFHKAFS